MDIGKFVTSLFGARPRQTLLFPKPVTAFAAVLESDHQATCLGVTVICDRPVTALCGALVAMGHDGAMQVVDTRNAPVCFVEDLRETVAVGSRETMTVSIIHGDCRAVLATLASDSIHCVVTSPPYFRPQKLRRRWPDRAGANAGRIHSRDGCGVPRGAARDAPGRDLLAQHGRLVRGIVGRNRRTDIASGLRAQSCHQPAQDAQSRVQVWAEGERPDDGPVAIALVDDGWWLRKDIIWAKPNPMPESATDRPTSSHEHVFLLTKSPRYFYDADAVREGRTSDEDANTFRGGSFIGGETDNATLGKCKVVGNQAR